MAGRKTPDGMDHARRFARWYLEDVLALEAERDGLKRDNRRLTKLLYGSPSQPPAHPRALRSATAGEILNIGIHGTSWVARASEKLNAGDEVELDPGSAEMHGFRGWRRVR
jgi:hypothetical protein